MNRLIGTWVTERVVVADDHEPLVTEITGMTVLTRDLHFVEVLNGTVAGWSPTAPGSTVLARLPASISSFGTYEIDDTGAFRRRVLTGSSLPVWARTVQDSFRFSRVAGGHRMDDVVWLSPTVMLAITWRRIAGASDPDRTEPIADPRARPRRLDP